MESSEGPLYPAESGLIDPPDVTQRGPDKGVALCLSGGGYRAMLFHVGALWRLNAAGYLPKLGRVSSVSGGSIAAGVLGLAWSRLGFDADGVAQRFDQEVERPIRRLAPQTIDRPAVLRGIFGPGRISDQVIRAYRRYLFGSRTLQHLPDPPGPRFVINATNIQSGALWRFSKPYMWDYRVGEVANPRVELALAVAASSAFPPFLSPVVLRLPDLAYTPDSGTDLQYPPYTTKVFLSDGGVYDNLGLQTAWNGYPVILVSDGGGKMAPEGKPPGDWPRHARRVLDVIDNQVRSLRKRELIAAYERDPEHPDHKGGAFWGIRTDIADYGLSDALACPLDKTTALANVPRRLCELSPTVQEQLVNWGFAVCDAAMRRYVDRELPAPTGFPYPGVGVG